MNSKIKTLLKKADFWTYITIIMIFIFSLFLIYPLFSLFLSSLKIPKQMLGH